MNRFVIGPHPTDAASSSAICQRCGGTKPTCCSCPQSAADAARNAAQEIADYVSDGIVGMGNEVTETNTAKFVEIISKYLPAESVGERSPNAAKDLTSSHDLPLR